MADGFEAFHVPQQSRRDKLRVIGGAGQTQQCPLAEPSSANQLQVCSTSLLPLYDPASFVSNSDLLTCGADHPSGHNFQGEIVSATNEGCKGQPSGSSVKVEGGPNLMGFVGGTVRSSSSSSSVSHHPYLDPETSLPINPGLIQVYNSNPFLYTPQNLREFEQSYNGDEVMLFKPEPLSLSLSSQNTHHRYLPLELNLQRYGSTIYGDKGNDGGYGIPSIFVAGSAGSAPNDVSRSSVPLGPFTGYSSVLKQSRFLKPAQQLLEELCYIGGSGIYSEKLTADVSLMEPPPTTDSFGSAGDITDEPLGCSDGGEARRKKSRLLTMLDEIYRRYKQYYQQMQAVVTSFECVAGLGNAAPYANLAVKAMSKHFRCLKNAISDQLQFTNKSHLLVSHRKDASPRLITETNGDIHVEKPVHNAGFLDHQSVWRPHRGLPERAVTVLRAWLFEHFLHPYPTDTDKLMLAKQTGLSRNQVSNWFINARVRLWKPMVEEIHMLETRQAQKGSQKEDHHENAKRSADHLAPTSHLVSDNPSTSTDRVHDFPCKRNGNEQIPDIPMGRQQPFSLPCNNTLSSTQPLGVNVSIGSGSSVSLTLGLHQNIGLSEPFPASAAQRFGLNLEPNNEAAYVMGGFDSQNRHFGKDVMEGQLLHDFVR